MTAASGWGYDVLVSDVTFANFKSRTLGCGAIQTAITNSVYASDIIPLHKFEDCTFIDVTNDAFLRIIEPNPDWATVNDCGEFSCSGPLNIVFYLVQTNFQGTATLDDTTATQTITTALTDTPYYNNCDYVQIWNGWQCIDRNIGQLLFESLDPDA